MVSSKRFHLQAMLVQHVSGPHLIDVASMHLKLDCSCIEFFDPDTKLEQNLSASLSVSPFQNGQIVSKPVCQTVAPINIDIPLQH